MTIFFANSIRIHIFCEFTWNSLSVSRIHFQFNIFFANLLRIHFYFRKFTFNFLSFSQIPYLFREFLRINFYFRKFSFNSLSFSWIHYEFTTFFANPLQFQLHWSIKWYTISSLPIFDHLIWFLYWWAFLKWILPAGYCFNRG